MAEKKAKKKAAKSDGATKREAKAKAAPKGCSIAKCKRAARAKRYCRIHYKKWRRGELPKSRYTRCHKEGCRKPMGRMGLCEEHGAAALGKTVEAAAAAPPTA